MLPIENASAVASHNHYSIASVSRRLPKRSDRACGLGSALRTECWWMALGYSAYGLSRNRQARRHRKTGLGANNSKARTAQRLQAPTRFIATLPNPNGENNIALPIRHVALATGRLEESRGVRTRTQRYGVAGRKEMGRSNLGRQTARFRVFRGAHTPCERCVRSRATSPSPTNRRTR